MRPYNNLTDTPPQKEAFKSHSISKMGVETETNPPAHWLLKFCQGSVKVFTAAKLYASMTPPSPLSPLSITTAAFWKACQPGKKYRRNTIQVSLIVHHSYSSYRALSHLCICALGNKKRTQTYSKHVLLWSSSRWQPDTQTHNQVNRQTQTSFTTYAINTLYYSFLVSHL